MSKNTELKEKWELLVKKLSTQFADGDAIDLDSIIYLIGVQELGQGIRDFDKEEKTNLLHIATCKLLSPFGYYKFENIDEDGWPHFEVVKDLEDLSSVSQELLMKKSIINYFK